MLSIHDLHKAYGPQVVFAGANLQMGTRERLGLVGRNGEGKTTLLRLLLGLETPDAGRIALPKEWRLGHLAQHLHFTQPTVRDEACLGLRPEEAAARYKAEAILFGMGFGPAELDAAPASLSGGYQIRINLAKLLVSDPDLLLLDEPTNYLDIITIRWLQRFLQQWRKALILITHDRGFMDAVTTHTALIHRQRIRRQPGPAAQLLAQVDLEEATYERTRQNEERQRRHIEAFVTRFKAKASMAARAQSRIKLLEKMPSREKLAFIRSLDFSFTPAPFEAKTLLKVERLHFSYLETQPLIADLSLQIRPRDRIALIGRNGRGKSTLLRLLAGELVPDRGMIKPHPTAQLGFFGQSNIDRLDATLTVEQEVARANAELTIGAVRGICGTMLFSGDLAKKPISVLSGGERSRVLLGKILAAPANLLLLDEPTNHLDIASVAALADSLDDFDGAVVLVTHDESLLRRLATRLVVFRQDGVREFDGGYDDFLAKLGWEEEASSRAATVVDETAPIVNRKELRRQRAAQLAERAKVVAPLKSEAARLEDAIHAAELAVVQAQEALKVATVQADIEALATHGRTIHYLEQQIERDFSALAEVTRQMESLAEDGD